MSISEGPGVAVHGLGPQESPGPCQPVSIEASNLLSSMGLMSFPYCGPTAAGLGRFINFCC